MSKKNRNLRKHYRQINRKVESFNLAFGDGVWYNHWHKHLDWDSITNTSQKHRKKHILAYLKIIDKIEFLAKGSNNEFQAWIYLDGLSGCDDAIYFHTRNPNSTFPFSLLSIELNSDMPTELIEILDLSKYTVGRLCRSDGKTFDYIIQKRGVGLEIKQKA